MVVDVLASITEHHSMMSGYSISQLAAAFGLSRSTLLYYDRIDLLPASMRTISGYRRYSEEDYRRLERVCVLRSAGLPLSDIKMFLENESEPSVHILEKRLKELEEDVVSLRRQQHTIVSMLKGLTEKQYGAIVDKTMWVNMLKSAGMNEEDMMRWHVEFERRSPTEHHAFLLSLGIDEEEALNIRKRSQSREEG